MIKKFKALMTQAHKIITENEEKKEADKIGVLRAGSCGALVNGKVLAADCGRKAQARYLGHQTTPTESNRVMFEGGLTMENHLATRFDLLKLAYQREVNITGEIAPGIIISGRPDFEVLMNNEWVGIEVKSLASPFSAIKLNKNGFPFMKHLLQAATYMLLTDRDEWMIVVGHSFNTNQNGQKIDSQLKWFEMYYNRETNNFGVTNEKGVTSILPFTRDHVVDYYREVLQKTKQKVLMMRPTEKELNVDTYDRCKYCPMQSACNEYDNKQIDFDQWLARFNETKGD